MCDIWIEKYRPQYLSDVEGNPETIARLRSIARDGNMVNLLIAGPPGTGKTTSVLALAREMLGEYVERAVMELNASDDRGIDVVRNRIKAFAQARIDLPPNRHKVVILDEVDSMTEAAQQALRRLIEVHSDTTRFALACNQSTKVIEPIQSRCAIVRYGKLSDEQILKRLLYICKTEKVDYVEDGLEALIFSADGDMRNAINNLQATVGGFELVNRDNVLKVCDMPPPEKVKEVVQVCLDGDWRSAHTICEEMISEGYTPVDITGVMRNVLRRMGMAEHVSLELLKEVGRSHFAMMDGCGSALQLDALLANFCRIGAQFSLVVPPTV